MKTTRPVKYILVTGGVVSSLGKGLAAQYILTGGFSAGVALFFALPAIVWARWFRRSEAPLADALPRAPIPPPPPPEESEIEPEKKPKKNKEKDKDPEEPLPGDGGARGGRMPRPVERPEDPEPLPGLTGLGASNVATRINRIKQRLQRDYAAAEESP